MRKIKFSVVMPVYNSEGTIKEAIDSLLNQRVKPFEIILIDSSNNSNSKNIIYEYSINNYNIKYYEYNKLGISNALNFGITRVNGTHIARFDSDDIADPAWLEAAEEYIHANPKVSIFSCGYYPFKSTINECEKLVIHPSENKLIRALLIFCSPICHPGSIIDVGVFQVLKYRNRPAEDHDLWCRASKFFLFGNIENGLIFYRKSNTSLSSKKGMLLSLSTIFNGIITFLNSFSYYLDLYSSLNIEEFNSYSNVPINKIENLKKISQFLTKKK